MYDADVSELLYDALRLHFTLLHKYVSLFVCCLFCRLDHLWGPPPWGSLCEFSHLSLCLLVVCVAGSLSASLPLLVRLESWYSVHPGRLLLISLFSSLGIEPGSDLGLF